ncbi:RNase L inhibitor [Sulfolobus sp. B1]|uniref:RNase L inhibitor n=1 Tax=Sulfolobus sp. B1 TaxID=2200888 RepID=UPI00117D5DD0|nr:RNase L inhibitor [Sulfolobus sp. B1]TRM96970.1 RNase L inhibitor [Sulfolobus sp. B1]
MSYSFLIKLLGLDKVLKEIVNDLGDNDLYLVLPKVKRRENSIEILREILKSYGLEINIEEVNGLVDDRRKLTALASNISPLNLKEPEKILWELAQSIKPKKVDER